MKRKLLTVIATIATVLAATSAFSACWWFLYQPEEPDSLKDM